MNYKLGLCGNMLLNIAVTGKMGAGKTEVAFIIQELDKSFKLERISGKLKAIVNEMKLPYTRDTLQNIAACFRSIDQLVWIKYLIRQINSNPSSSIVIDDVRYHDERNLLKENNFVLIKVVTNNDIRRERIAMRDKISITDEDWVRWRDHATEIEVEQIECDYIINNDGTREELKNKVQEILQDIKGKKKISYYN